MTRNNLITQIESWHHNQQHGDIIQLVASLPINEQTGEILSLLARAYINIEELSKAINILERINKDNQDGLTCVRYGLALFISQKENEALAWFEKASEMGIKEFDELPGTYYPKTISKWLERAKIGSLRRTEKLAFERQRREKRNKIHQDSVSLKDIKLDDLWNDCDYSLKEYVGKTVSSDDFEKVEEMLGYRLPEAYKLLMQSHNGGLLLRDTFENPLQCDWAPRTYSVESIFGVDFEKATSLCGKRGSKFWIEEWGYPEIGIAICDTISGGHNIIFLDYSDCGKQGEPCVVEIDQESNYEITYLADNFKDFINGLFEYEEEDED